MQNRTAMWNSLRVPDVFQDLVHNDITHTFLANYVVTIIPRMTWEDIFLSLHEYGEEKARTLVRCYLPHIVDGKSACYSVVSAWERNSLLPRTCWEKSYVQIFMHVCK